jgi:hypothetical protein
MLVQDTYGALEDTRFQKAKYNLGSFNINVTGNYLDIPWPLLKSFL